MILIKPSFEILNCPDPNAILYLIELAGRTCYKSESKDHPEEFVSRIIKLGHLSVIEHASITVRIICDRGVTHEIVRHRLASYSQESTRYCNYKGGVTFVIPPWLNLIAEEVRITPQNGLDPIRFKPGTQERYWVQSMLISERQYQDVIDNFNWTPQQARSVLPNSLKTEIVMTANLREWRYFFKLRTSKAAHPQMREITIPMLGQFKKILPIVFEDILPNL